MRGHDTIGRRTIQVTRDGAIDKTIVSTLYLQRSTSNLIARFHKQYHVVKRNYKDGSLLLDMTGKV